MYYMLGLGEYGHKEQGDLGHHYGVQGHIHCPGIVCRVWRITNITMVDPMPLGPKFDICIWAAFGYGNLLVFVFWQIVRDAKGLTP